mmetsp:Transcript_2821/g.1928  ORF Transcript_2821/g.1928 Transcript_2821/m.1928 type:complete len:122 (-) Transcript_2821:239-604(-)|eukprot:CAMPEP_0202978740 /NCGR_PEP_ID=MMETSP1396-20130829/85075_1 /ASSEMBLY_ACC=CAM_ASM_000872 /TAXON_ID= /ORGANISM="Pseudokeronopsis sp., Strain Brazil" /LENGTH=121 /DNA_ID=CAMNT_0049717835 /DNA_START=821 /DNA_END=1186 /DNA_ORIENTATION=+
MSKKGSSNLAKSNFLAEEIATCYNCNLGCCNIYCAVGLSFGFAAIIQLISSSNSLDLYADGENYIAPPSLSLCQMRPFWGRFRPDASSSREAPREKMSAFGDILSVIVNCSETCISNSGAM